MLGLLLLAGGLVLASPASTSVINMAPIAACREIFSCSQTDVRVLVNATYEECKTKLPSLYSAQAQCLLAAYDRVLKQRLCRCEPFSLIPLYMAASPSSVDVAKLVGCSMLAKDAFPARAGCLPEPCRAALPRVTPHHLIGLVSGTCSSKQRDLKQQFVSCLTSLKTADLSRCGAVHDIVHKVAPLFGDIQKFLCSGCATARLLGDCDPKKIVGDLRAAFRSTCGVKKAVDAMRTCLKTAAGAQPACSTVPVMLDKLQNLSISKMIHEACAIETQVKYAETYQSWGCKVGKGKRRTPLADSQRTRRGGGDTLLDLWSALEEHF